ncbi:Autophagy-related protein 18a [Spatholobus suberectus]|nr:Autophagy-related protein 18a [Spatholobus suberectus]
MRPFREIFWHDFDLDSKIGHVHMLSRCNIPAFAGDFNPCYLPKKVMIWDNHQSRYIGKLSFRFKVKGVRLWLDQIMVVLAHKIFMYDFANLKH